MWIQEVVDKMEDHGPMFWTPIGKEMSGGPVLFGKETGRAVNSVDNKQVNSKGPNTEPWARPGGLEHRVPSSHPR